MSDSNNNIPSVKEIENARIVLDTYNINKTSLQKSNTFSKIIGNNLYLKNEALQATGTFKIRGALYKIDKIIREQKAKDNRFDYSNSNSNSKATNIDNRNIIDRYSDKKNNLGIIAASAGNHAQGVALASQMNNLPCTIVMPTKAPTSKIAATKAYGAKVIVEGEDYDDSFLLSEKIAKYENLYQIHAYDDHDVIVGQGTIGLEILEDLPDVDEIYVPIGGGGLASGISIAIKSRKPGVKIIGVESEAYPAMKQSLEKGFVHSIKKGDTIADSISIKSPGRLTFNILKEYLDDIVLVDDLSIVKAMFLLMEREKLVIEPSGSVAIAYFIKIHERSKNYYDLDRNSIDKNKIQKNVVALLSGGNVDMYLLGQIVSKGLMQTGRLFKIFIKLPDKSGSFKNIIDILVDLRINIVEVFHDRLSPNIAPGTAGVFLSLEMENESYSEKLVSKLKEKGIDFTI
ncbi:MAG TPA: pyridoxal-phosphate dependent enzyme [Verrucomicrobiae bacterium]|nr:pyridoxal-phosphate dependent enzyme [Verrucomicrobiae bacterium]